MAGERRFRHQSADNRSSLDSVDRGQCSGPDYVADVSAKVRVLDPFAQSTDQKTPEPKLKRKRKIVRIHVAPRMVLVAQQPRFGFFANDTW
jgi:hypothetical protein